MSIVESRLAGACRRVSDASKGILDWVVEATEISPAERVALLHEVYRTESSAAMLTRAMADAPATAIVGPSKSGKTQVLACLIERDGGPVTIRFEGIREVVGLQKHLVPEGARNGLSCILRLTSRPRPPSQNFPVLVRLLSTGDVIKILGALFLAGAEPRDMEPSIGMIDQLIEEARGRVGREAVEGLAEEDIWDLRHYFSTRFGEEPLVRALLTSGYWESVTGLAGHLGMADRARLLSVLWGGSEMLTATFCMLGEAILGLGCGREARCALDALLGLDSRTGRFQRRADSIISAATLSGLGDASSDTLVVSNEHGQWVSIPRAVLAALVAEVRLPIATSGSNLIEGTDLLEFPSIDGRRAGTNGQREIERDSGRLGAALMRAKASYLLERYTEEQAITAMAVCVDPGSTRLGELADLVTAWVERSYGADAAAREQHTTGLFVCLTKLDKEFQEPARRGKERRIDWSRQIATVLNDGLSCGRGWAAEWTPGQPFDSVHLLRLPGTKAKHLVNYASDSREIGYKPEQKARIERARRDFLASPLVMRHVRNAATVWREALELNDGGATLLAQSIADVADARAKERLVAAGLSDLGRSLSSRLQRYHVSDDTEHQKDKRKVAAVIAMRWLRRCAEGRKLGQLIHGLQLSDGELNDLLDRHETGSKPTAANGHGAATHNGSAGRSVPTDAMTVTEKARACAALAMGHWVASVRLFAQTDHIVRTLRVPRQGLLLIVDELVAGAARLDLEGRIASEIEALSREDPDGDCAQQAAIVAASLIGDFVMWLGFDDVRSNAHPRRRGRAGAPIFPPRTAAGAFAETDEGADNEALFFADWSQALLALVAANAEELGAAPVDAERNRRLGELLANLTPPV